VASAFFAALSVYFAFTFHFATKLLGSPAFTVDQILATLTLTVGLVGLIVAIVAVGIGIAAIIGYAEIKQITSRKADELLRRVIDRLRKRGDLSSGEAQLLRQFIDDEEVGEGEPPSRSGASNNMEGTSTTESTSRVEGTQQYPADERRDNGNDSAGPRIPL